MATKLPPLEVFILQAGTVRRVLIDDPRDAFCAEFNRKAERFGMKAVTHAPQQSDERVRPAGRRKSALPKSSGGRARPVRLPAHA